MSVTLRIPRILETLPKAELPASVQLHVCTDKAKPDSDEESCISLAYHFGTNISAQAILQGITMSIQTENSTALMSKPPTKYNPTTFLSTSHHTHLHFIAPKGTQHYYRIWTKATSYKPVTQYKSNFYKESDKERLTYII
jgi:hypothetical protein